MEICDGPGLADSKKSLFHAARATGEASSCRRDLPQLRLACLVPERRFNDTSLRPYCLARHTGMRYHDRREAAWRSPDQIAENVTFVDDLGADSLDTVEIVLKLEEEFDRP